MTFRLSSAEDAPAKPTGRDTAANRELNTAPNTATPNPFPNPQGSVDPGPHPRLLRRNRTHDRVAIAGFANAAPAPISTSPDNVPA